MPHNTPRRMHHATGSRFIKRNCCMTQTNTKMPARVRCSRPLCSSQTTTPYHTPRTRPPPATKDEEQPRTHEENAARKPETHKPASKNTQPSQATHPTHGPVASGPNSVPNTKNRLTPTRTVPRHSKSIRTRDRKEPTGRYLLIFHP
jgi:hypothetical protein